MIIDANQGCAVKPLHSVVKSTGSTSCDRRSSTAYIGCCLFKVSSAEIERACMACGVNGVHELAAVGVPPTGGGPESLVVFSVLSGDNRPSEENLKALFTKALKDRLNPLFKVWPH